jgi:signal transduction histidine kinase
MASAGSASAQGNLRREWGFWILYFMPWVAVMIRFWVSTVPQYGFLPLPMALLAAFFLLSISAPAIAVRYPALTQSYLFLETVLIAVLIQTDPSQDYYALLFMPLGILATRYLRPGRDLIWLGVFCIVLSVALVTAFGLSDGVTYFPIYVIAILLLSFYGRASRRAEEAREQSERLLGELRDANVKLRAYAEQAEEVAVVHERNRLARELHDAATQTVFSITLTAQAARMACDQDPSRLPELLDKIQESGADALAEMRGLVSGLRPRRVAEDGLAATLRQHFALRERREQLRVIFSIEGEERGEIDLKEALLRIVQESLNNVVKHAGVREAEVSLVFAETEVRLRVRDSGGGFDPGAAAGAKGAGGAEAAEGFGLASMRERVESRGGSLQVISRPGAGTEIAARLPLPAEREHDGQDPADQGSDR